ncbi:hypothetical protein IWQ55_004209 [Labrenzia sp. EL_208]|nr:hypothetical protein [Labrenzia sp. EL_132]MBG6230985.1 hypothetical protein [Labrenzia sp. EL_208]
MRRSILAASLALSFALPALADDAVQMISANAAYDAEESMSLTFIFHIDEDLAEQDVFIEKVAGSGELFRPTGATRNMDAPLYAPADAVPHTPLQIKTRVHGRVASRSESPWETGSPPGGVVTTPAKTAAVS